MRSLSVFNLLKKHMKGKIMKNEEMITRKYISVLLTPMMKRLCPANMRRVTERPDS